MAEQRKPFTYVIHSRDRVSGSTSEYLLAPFREVVGDWRVSVRAAPFAATGNACLELQMRASGLTGESTSPTSWRSVLSTIPGYASSVEGWLVVSSGLRGPLEVRWLDTEDAGQVTDTSAFPEHTLYTLWEPL